VTRFRNWVLSLPWPWWTISSCKPFAPWCFLDDIAHYLFPQTFGWSEIVGDTDVSHWPDEKPWICRMHERSIDAKRKWPEDE